jgi:3-isopropylmalate/(R)-2-methylmalate dehydratase large subunit
MSTPLSQREVKKRDPQVKIEGRILYLTEDPDLIRRQLAGEDLKWTPTMKLRDNISTDEITPAYICYYHDETLGDFPYLGLQAGGEFPVSEKSVRQGGFAVSVSGKRRGKGSSREQSPYAEMMAGIQLVVAENIERIYHQNCLNLGMLATTDFSVIERVKTGETIPLSVFTEGKDEVTREIIEYGGLFNFNLARLQGKVVVPAIKTAARPMTVAEKIFAKHMVTDLAKDEVGVEAVAPGDSGFVRCDLRFSHEYVTPMAAIFYENLVGKEVPLRDRESVVFFRDHLTFLEMAMTQERIDAGLLTVAQSLATKQAQFAEDQDITLHGETTAGGSEAICHSKVTQSYALPGQLIIGTDSHTPHSGALGCVAFGVGTTAIFNSWITKDTMARVPESVKIEISGKRRPGVTAKDFMLEILRHPYVRDGHAIGKIVEYCGEAVKDLSVDERATMTNMAAEVGALTGIVAPDQKTVEFLMDWRGMKREKAEQLIEGLQSDPEAQYAETLRFDAASIEPLVALPGDPGNGVAISELPNTVKIDIAYAGSCTAGKKEDMDMYAEVLENALSAGRRVHPDVTFWIQFGSQEVKEYCRERGYLELFEKVGARVIEPSCGACINAGPGVSDNRDQVTVSAINRNFPGRSGPGQMYLASPYTVAASALAGQIEAYEPSLVA